MLEIFAPVHKRPTRGSYTGYGKRLPSDRPPVLTPKELALTAASDGKDLPTSLGNGQAPARPGLPAERRSQAASATRSVAAIRWVAATRSAAANPLGGGNPLAASRPTRPVTVARTTVRRRRGPLSDGDFDLPRIERAVREILLAIGEDPDRDGLRDTPARVARALCRAVRRAAA